MLRDALAFISFVGLADDVLLLWLFLPFHLYIIISCRVCRILSLAKSLIKRWKVEHRQGGGYDGGPYAVQSVQHFLGAVLMELARR